MLAAKSALDDRCLTTNEKEIAGSAAAVERSRDADANRQSRPRVSFGSWRGRNASLRRWSLCDQSGTGWSRLAGSCLRNASGSTACILSASRMTNADLVCAVSPSSANWTNSTSRSRTRPLNTSKTSTTCWLRSANISIRSRVDLDGISPMLADQVSALLQELSEELDRFSQWVTDLSNQYSAYVYTLDAKYHAVRDAIEVWEPPITRSSRLKQGVGRTNE